MKKRALGTQGLTVSEIGLGCMNLSQDYGIAIPDEPALLAVIDRAVELGVTFFDSAEMYGPFINEVLVGKGLRRVRDSVVIATKFGFDIPADGGRPRGVDSRPAHIREVCDASLKRLGVETIDLFYQHRVDPKVPIGDVAGTVGDLVRQGKVRYFGLSEASAITIARAHAVHPVSAVQSEYSLWWRGVEQDVLPVCRRLGIGFVPFSPLGRGFLAGATPTISDQDWRRGIPRFQGAAFESNLKLLAAFTALAQNKRCTPAQVAIAWLLHQGDDIVPIPGTNKLHRIEENAAAVGLRLSREDLNAIERAIPADAIVGERYDAIGGRLLDRS
jgi:aryl-alcohol dehydrogenase-like predicted oxidoreductase